MGGGIREQWLSLHAFIASTSGVRLSHTLNTKTVLIVFSLYTLYRRQNLAIRYFVITLCSNYFVITYCVQDVENHCLLLCSLLLGFGLDSYVCVGTKARGTPHLWVMTVSNDEPTFWDAVTGQRYNLRYIFMSIVLLKMFIVSLTIILGYFFFLFLLNWALSGDQAFELSGLSYTNCFKTSYSFRYTSHDTPPYKSIDSVFNHTHFYANTQPSNSVTKTKYEKLHFILF